MEIAFWIVLSVGAIVIVAAVVFGCLWFVDGFLDWRKEPHQRSFLEGRANERNRLLQDSWWFSESPATCELLRDLGNQLSVYEAREKWRKAMSAEAREAST
jgi:hypothetical protein